MESSAFPAQREAGRPAVPSESAQVTLGDALDANRALQKSAAVKLFAANNSALYVTLMERHLDYGTKMSEVELTMRLERDLAELDLTDDQPTGLELVKLWARQGWLHRVTDTTDPDAPNLCHLTSEARTVLDFMRRQRREDSIATGGSITGIAAELRRVAGQVSNDPETIRLELEAQMSDLDAELADLEAGRRPPVDLRVAEDSARAIGYQMEQIISDIGQYGTMLDRITTALLDDPGDSDLAYRDRQRQLFDDYEALLQSSQSASYQAFSQMIQDPERRARLKVDIDTIIENFPGMDAGLRSVMDNFFGLVTQQMAEVGRTRQRCARRIRRFVASGTLEQSRGLARQLNDALATANDLLKSSLADRRLGYELPLAAPTLNSIGRLAFEIREHVPPAPALPAGGADADLTAFASMTGQVDTVELTETVNNAVTAGPVALTDVIEGLDEPYLAHVIVLWSWAQKQAAAGEKVPMTTVRFRSLLGEDHAIEVPDLTFTEPIPTAEVDAE
ncbi:DUF3375 domain-containing protein [Gordonia alkanivorans]|uniref:DUF3375 domain-containing protein n=1 Tax=Gordonia TaxID=2053 RepID=UPI0024B81DF1|nr:MULTISPECIES: DUF3375 domain-containing protein [Gordonia]MDJ0027160.1 DUF3375 domain-containing protein [Gordonia alkanivorans]WJG11422.1 DUF3375 domain-containing protein [Gordonia sp. Swx-4]